jgi:hypothetical protein
VRVKIGKITLACRFSLSEQKSGQACRLCQIFKERGSLDRGSGNLYATDSGLLYTHAKSEIKAPK